MLYLALLASGASGRPEALEWEALAADGHELKVLLADDKDLVETACAHVSAAWPTCSVMVHSCLVSALDAPNARHDAGALTSGRFGNVPA